MAHGKDFLSDKYLEENQDLISAFGGNPSAEQLEAHYLEHGKQELRGEKRLAESYNVERVFCSRSGRVFVSGWINRNMHAVPTMHIRHGYDVFRVGPECFSYFVRNDVNSVLNEVRGQFAFIAIVDLGTRLNASTLWVALHSSAPFQPYDVKPTSDESFLDNALVALSFPFANEPESVVKMVRGVSGQMRKVWKDYLSKVITAELGSFGVDETKPDLSMITVLYRKYDLLMVQAANLEPFVRANNAEWVIVLNDVKDHAGVLRVAAAASKIYGIPIRVFSCSQNSGFSYANNFAVSVSRSDTCAFVNPDLFPNPDVQDLDVLKHVQDDHILGVQMVYENGALMHDGMHLAISHGYDPELRSETSLLRVEHFRKNGIPPTSQTWSGGISLVPACSGAFLIFRKSLFEKLKGLSQDMIFAHYEDADMCLRAWEAGYKVGCIQIPMFIHHEGIGSHSSPKAQSMLALNRQYFTDRWLAKWSSFSGRLDPDDEQDQVALSEDKEIDAEQDSVS